MDKLQWFYMVQACRWYVHLILLKLFKLEMENFPIQIFSEKLNHYSVVFKNMGSFAHNLPKWQMALKMGWSPLKNVVYKKKFVF